MNSPVIHVVDDDGTVRTSLQVLLEAVGYTVRTYGSATEFLSNPLGEAGGCIVLDLRMPGLNGLELQQALSEAGVSLPVVFLTAHGNVPSSVQAMKSGAVDFLLKPPDPAQLLAAIKQAVEQDAEVRRIQAAKQLLRSRIAELSPREQQVLSMVAAGMLNKQIAAALGISIKTTKTHRGRVMQKLGLSSVSELVLIADRLGLIATDGNPPSIG